MVSQAVAARVQANHVFVWSCTSWSFCPLHTFSLKVQSDAKLTNKCGRVANATSSDAQSQRVTNESYVAGPGCFEVQLSGLVDCGVKRLRRLPWWTHLSCLSCSPFSSVPGASRRAYGNPASSKRGFGILKAH